MYHPLLYPDQFSMVVRTGNRTGIQGLNFGVSWKLQSRGVVPAVNRD